MGVDGTVQTSVGLESMESRLRHLYEEQGYSVSQLARVFDCSTTEVYDDLRDSGLIEEERFLDSLPTLATDHEGYERWEHGSHRVRVHRLLMVAECGFEAVANAEVVHHESFTWDNRPDALILFATHEDHMNYHNNRLNGEHEAQQRLTDVDSSPVTSDSAEGTELPDSPEEDDSDVEMETQRTLDEFIRV